MIEELQILARLIDYPVTVVAFIWALRMIQSMHNEIICMLTRCLDEQYQDDNIKLTPPTKTPNQNG